MNDEERTRQTRLERPFEELMTQTRRDLAKALLIAREHASHPYITRLERENAGMRAIVQAMSKVDLEFSEHSGKWHCPQCDARSMKSPTYDADPPEHFIHAPDCPVVQARALVEQWQTDAPHE